MFSGVEQLKYTSSCYKQLCRLSFLQRPVTSIIPLSSAAGNVTVAFAVLSYAGSLTITVIADPDTCPDLSELRDVLEEELRVLVGAKHQ